MYSCGMFLDETSCFVCVFTAGVFDVLAYTDTDVAVPFTWIESDPKLIANPQMVKLHSFDTKVESSNLLVDSDKKKLLDILEILIRVLFSLCRFIRLTLWFRIKMMMNGMSPRSSVLYFYFGCHCCTLLLVFLVNH